MKNKPVFFSTLVALLWMVNTLELQPYEFELRSTVAISKHRVPLLQNLALERDSKLHQAGKATDIRLIHCVPFVSESANKNATTGTLMDADLQTVKVLVRYRKYTDVETIEKWLESETRPTRLSDRCQSTQSRLHAARWRLDSLTHTKRILIADKIRRAEQFALQGEEPASKFKMVGFRRTGPPEDGTQDVIDSLSIQQEREEQKIASLSNELAREIAVSNGFLQFSGAPKWYPVAESIGLRRGISFVVFAMATWGICRILFLSINNGMVKAASIVKSIFRVRRSSLAMPYFGHVELSLSEHLSHEELIARIGEVGDSIKRHSRNSLPSSPSRFRVESFVRTCFTGCLAAWVTIVVLRLIFDPAWRSLFVTAPLAAISNLISGVGL